ncbi:hypothetical protein [Mesorhizobium sp. ORS 3428]|uniref:hypothetical protein n=1 Tax=Mesorhizobium sp. ORS 3428 TaxID=540997 RepID=UPI0008DAC25D|nr:hypothetical protein [Mesorhizobium sp. ORS 3428]OHV86530.1 hypothetical protein ORS3428_23380 [Mesorhizobium sp. ORS 3428]
MLDHQAFLTSRGRRRSRDEPDAGRFKDAADKRHPAGRTIASIRPAAFGATMHCNSGRHLPSPAEMVPTREIERFSVPKRQDK